MLTIIIPFERQADFRNSDVVCSHEEKCSAKRSKMVNADDTPIVGLERRKKFRQQTVYIQWKERIYMKPK